MSKTSEQERDDFIRALRQLADFFEQHPNMPVPYSETFNVFPGTKEEMARIARLTSWEKEYNGDWFILRRTFSDALKLEVNLARERICRRVVVGKKTIPARPEQTVDDVIWECDDLSIIAPKTTDDAVLTRIANKHAAVNSFEEEERRHNDMATDLLMTEVILESSADVSTPAPDPVPDPAPDTSSSDFSGGFDGGASGGGGADGSW